jgi:hypothetical protein
LRARGRKTVIEPECARELAFVNVSRLGGYEDLPPIGMEWWIRAQTREKEPG